MKNGGAVLKNKATLVSSSGPWASPVFVCTAPVFINGRLDARQTSGFLLHRSEVIHLKQKPALHTNTPPQVNKGEAAF